MNRIKVLKRDLEVNKNVLRAKGIIPGTIYGPMIENTPIKTTTRELTRANGSSGEVYLVNIRKVPLFVKIGDIQRDPVTQRLIHFSLVQMPEGLDNNVQIPVNFKGTPLGVKRGGRLVIIKDQIKVHGKPILIPEHIDANISRMDIGDKLTVHDLTIPSRVDAINKNSEVIAVCRPSEKKISMLADELNEKSSEMVNKEYNSFFSIAI